ncbi:MAG: hypothetical protein ACI9DF_004648 [Verrucomicrobiales bacterium]|jgi:hypothetical protein
MKTPFPLSLSIIPSLLAISLLGWSLAADKKPSLSFRAQQLHKDNNEGCAVGDLNNDGHPDIVAGENWYAGPAFSEKRRLRKLLPFGKDYLQDNGDHLYDVNGDGWLDVVAGEFTTTQVFWYENPGDSGLTKSALWEIHPFVDTKTEQNEMTFLHDIDGDGNREYLENSWNDANPLLIWRFTKDAEGNPSLTKHVVSESGNGHGMGFGDINGDGKEDIVFKQGWYECPKAGPYSGPWAYHSDFVLPHASCPIFVRDLNADGRNDLIWADGHSYGLYWEEQRDPNSDGSTNWKQHLIDKSFAQGHALAWDDIDNDGAPELITGKRYFAHSGGDPGANDPVVIHYYDFDPKQRTFTKSMISQGKQNSGPGTGLQIRLEDLDANGWKDVVVAGKSGTHVLWNNGF